MRDWGDSYDDMERFALDPDTAEGLLSGALDPEDAPHRYGEVASLLRIAAGRTSGALDGEAAAVAATVEAIRSSPSATPPPVRHRTGASIKVKSAIAGVVAVLTVTGSLAAADALPAPAQRVASDALAVVGVHVPSRSENPTTVPASRGNGTPASTTAPAAAGTSVPSVTTASTGGPRTQTTAVSTPTTTGVTTSSAGAGAGAGRTETTTAPASNPQSGTPQSGPPPQDSGTQPSAAPAPSASPSPQKQAERPAGRTGGTNGTTGANGADGASGAPGGTQSEGSGTPPTTTAPGS